MSNSWTKTLYLVSQIDSEKIRFFWSHENVGQQNQNTQVLANILAWQKSKARSRVWIVQNDVHIAETST